MALTRLVKLLLRLLRFPNLLVVALTQYLVAYHVLRPALLANDIAPALSDWKFIELAVITVLITASGYVVNDLQDEELDDINRPGTNPVQELGRDQVLWYYGAMLLAGFLVSQLLAFRLGETHLLWIYPLAISILALYSVYLKRRPLLGNILVAFYCAGVPGVVLLAERDAIRNLYDVAPVAAGEALSVCFLFMLFAFIATLLRELVKDLEDLKGDTQAGRKTIPVLWGPAAGRRIAVGMAGLTIAAILSPILLGWTAFQQPLLIGACLLLIASLAIIAVQIIRAGAVKDYHRISTELKVLLFAGLLLLIFV